VPSQEQHTATSFRLNKHQLYSSLENQDKQYALMIIYTAKKTLPYTDIEKAMKKIIRKFEKM